MNIFWFSFSISLQNIRKKGTSWILSNISPKKRVQRYLRNTIFNFKLKFHLEVGLVEQRYFELFSWHGPYFHPTKDRCSTSPTSPFFTFVVILVIFAALKSSIFFCGKFGTSGTQKEQQIWIVVFLGWETEGYFCQLFAPFYSRAALNT